MLNQLSFAQSNVLLQDHWMDTNILIGVEDARFSDVWGFEFEGNNFCAVGSTEGIEWLKIADGKFEYVDQSAGAFQGYTVVHRDMKTYKNYLYAVGDEGTATLQIFDFSFLPDSVSKVYDSNALFGICHNIFIDTLNAKLYACGPNGTGMKVLDISDPVTPILLHDFNVVNYVHDCYVRNDTAFLNCGFDGLQVWNFSGSIPQQLGVLDFYVNQGYNHSGWLSKDATQYAFIDETEGTKIKLCSTANLSQILVDRTFGTTDYQNYVPHNIILLNHLAIVAYYNEGLRIFDISQSPIRQVGYYDTFQQETQYKLNGAWGVYVFEDDNQIVISDRQNGIYLFEFPIDVFENQTTGAFVTNIPFIDESSRLILRDYVSEDVTFDIIATNGQVVYRQENFLKWMNVPLELKAGTYIFAVYDQDGDPLESGKFVKAN